VITKKISRWTVKVFFLALSFALLVAGPLPEWILRAAQPTKGFLKEVIVLPVWMVKWVPGISPLSFLSSLEAHRGERLAFLWLFPVIILLLIFIHRGRFFCRWICPLGTIYEATCLKNMKTHLLKRRISGYFFWGIVFSSAAGFPIFLFFDPLSTFTRVNLVFEGSMTLASAGPGLVLPIFIILGLFQPMIWCAKICPLGHMVDFFVRTDEKYTEKFKKERREIVTGMILAVPAFFLIRKNPFVNKEFSPVLPPGAGDKETFSALCSRCYACVNVCPTRILTVDFPRDADMGRWFEPEMDAYNGTCQESCNNCTQVCPTAAIKKLSFEDKHRTQIGVAQVFKEKCIAWCEKDYCVVCIEFCPYKAIEDTTSESGYPRPVVNPEICRGCGICQNACPVSDNGAAIVVGGIKKQRRLTARTDSSIRKY